MPADEAAARAKRELVRRGYDVISRAYRTDDGAAHPSSEEDTSRYRPWAAELAALLPRIRDWLRPGGHVLAIVGAAWWTATEQCLGADMFWDDADTHAYLRWLRDARLTPVWHRFIPEGLSGHGLVLATAA